MLKGGSRPWSQTMVSEGARPWGRGRSGDCDPWRPLILGPQENRDFLGDENLTQTFFSQTFRAPPGYPGKIAGYPVQKV